MASNATTSGTRAPEPPRHWDDAPRALAVGTRLRVVSLAAGRAGVRAGMTIPEARARCAELDVRAWDEHAIADAVLAATTALLAASPQVTPVAGTPGMWWVGAMGFDALGGEEQLARTLLAIAQQWHPDARVAIAGSCVAARAATWAPLQRRAAPSPTDRNAARTGACTAASAVSSGAPSRAAPLPPTVTLVPHGHCAQYLAPAPLGLVPMPDDVREALQMLGLRTVGALAALAPGDVEQRWSAEGLTAWRLARGDDPRRPGLVRVEAARSASVELPAAVESAEPVLFVLRAQLQRLLRDCVHDGRAAAAVAITLVLDAGRQYPIEEIGSELDGHTQVPETSDDRPSSLLGIPQRSITREVRPARPLARLEPLFDQCRALLERWRIPAPIIGVTVSIPATAPLAADQGDLLVPSWRDMAMNAEAVFARLRAVLDPDSRGDVIVHPEVRDTHRVEETGAWASADAVALAAAALPAPPREPAVTPAVLRLLTPAEAVEVEAPQGVPGALWWRGRRLAFVSVQGPERLSGDWWRGDGYARDYWRGLAEGEGELLLYHEADARWYVQGWYD